MHHDTNKKSSNKATLIKKERSPHKGRSAAAVAVAGQRSGSAGHNKQLTLKRKPNRVKCKESPINNNTNSAINRLTCVSKSEESFLRRQPSKVAKIPTQPNVSRNNSKLPGKAREMEQMALLRRKCFGAPIEEKKPIHADQCDRITEMNSTYEATNENRFATFLSRFNYEILDELGSGGFSKVYKVRNRNQPNVIYACKIFDLLQVDETWAQRCLMKEMNIMYTIFHPNIIQLRDSLKTRRAAYIIMDFAPNGNVSSYMTKIKGPLTECQARIWFKDISSGLDYLHGKHIAHRDIKLENFLIDESYKALLSDFSFSISLDGKAGSELRKTVCGTAAYMAPEIHILSKDEDTYDAFAADMFSMGVSLFEMVNFDNPFEGDYGSPEIVRIMLERTYQLKPEVIVSTDCRELFENLLDPEPRNRFTSKEVLAHPWLNTVIIPN